MILSIIIPCYNEEQTIASVLEAVEKVPLSALNVRTEVIVVDDGSTDATWSILQECAKKHTIKILRHEKNAGKGSAIRSSIKLITGDVVLIQDADMEYSPDDYPLILKPFLDGTADVVYGSRFLAIRHPKGMKSLFYWGNRWLTFLANFLYGINITDEATCYKAFRTPILKAMELECKEFEFCPEVTAKLSLKKIKIVEVPVRYLARTALMGKKISWKDAYQATLTLIRYWLKSKLS